ncbi:MAG: hypothetical protein CL937_06545 [Deltaproteobacteria bacterium]|nr:hypothetical protein [Deltaproteobacteria bacterium]OUV98904.1 MAG: hypothetical protein CBD14_06300 [Proteobacteria bacterium TMED154]
MSVDFHGEILIIKFFATVWQEGRIRGALPSMAGCLMIQNWLGCSSMNSANSELLRTETVQYFLRCFDSSNRTDEHIQSQTGNQQKN